MDPYSMFDWLKSNYLSIVSTLTPILILIRLIYDIRKDTTKFDVTITRANSGPLALQHPSNEYIIFEISSQGSFPITINELGFISKKGKFINIVDMPWSFQILDNSDKALGSIKCISLPGIIPSRHTGIALINWSSWREANKNLANGLNSNPEENGYHEVKRLSSAFSEVSESLNKEESEITLRPYAVSTNGGKTIGKQVKIRLGHLHSTIGLPSHHQTFPQTVFNQLGVKVWN